MSEKEVGEVAMSALRTLKMSVVMSGLCMVQSG